jgi:DNA-binding ferritin-like protein
MSMGRRHRGGPTEGKSLMAGRAEWALGDELQDELRDLLSLAVVGDHVRWVLKGDEHGEFAHWLVDATGQWREWADQVAKRLITLGVAPDGRVRSLVKDVPINWVPDGWLQFNEAQQLIGDRLNQLAGWALDRRVHTTDPETLHLLSMLSSGLATQAATLQSSRSR